jgi:hypothetical protein
MDLDQSLPRAQYREGFKAGLRATRAGCHGRRLQICETCLQTREIVSGVGMKGSDCISVELRSIALRTLFLAETVDELGRVAIRIPSAVGRTN